MLFARVLRPRLVPVQMASDGERGGGSGAAEGEGKVVSDVDYVRWKLNTPFLYDWLQHYNSDWPALGMAWGQRVEDKCTATANVHQFFMSTRTSTSCTHAPVMCLPPAPPGWCLMGERGVGVWCAAARLDASTGRWTGWPNVVQVMEITMPKPHNTSHRRMASFDETSRSKAINVVKTIVHPSEVNRVR